jgi:DNA-binding transcriptional ArsR family regulator
MRKLSPLNALFPKTRQGILAATLGQPDKSWYTSELARRLGVPSSSLQRELKDLTEASILKAHRQGRMAYYQANRESPFYSDLHGLLMKTAGLADVLKTALEPLTLKIRVSFIYGSIASGTEHSHSDIDLMLIGQVPPIELALTLRSSREMLAREINPTVYTVSEYKKRRASKDHFLTRVLDKPKLFLLGSEDELDTIAGS